MAISWGSNEGYNGDIVGYCVASWTIPPFDDVQLPCLRTQKGNS